MQRPEIIDSWSNAREDLGVDISGPVKITLPSGLIIHADMLIKNFGNILGTIVVEDFEVIEPHLEEIGNAGYASSVFGRPAKHFQYDRALVIEVLRDWGWSGPSEDMPSWLLEEEESGDS